jgi:hypothetical protein
MMTDQGTQLQKLRTVQAFLDEHADLLPGVADSGARRMLTEVIAELSACAANQSLSVLAMQGATQKQYALRDLLLRAHMTPVARIARASLSTAPELDVLRMPRGHPTVPKLAAAATAMAIAAKKHASVFIAAGLPDDFAEQLIEAADALLDSVTERANHNGRRRGATTGLKSTLAKGKQLVAVLDSFVIRDVRENPALLAQWDGVRQLGRLSGRAPLRALATPTQMHAIAAPAEVVRIPATPVRLLAPSTSPDDREPFPDGAPSGVAATPTGGESAPPLPPA